MAFYFATDYMRKTNYFMEGLSVSHPIDPVPIHLKVALTLKETAEYSNIGINKIDYMLRQPNCPFVLYVGTKKLVKRKEFEAFISKIDSLNRTILPYSLYSLEKKAHL